MKKLPSKVPFLWHFGFFLSTALTAQNSPELKIHIRNVDQDTSFYFHRVDLNPSVLCYIFFLKKGQELSSFLCELVNFWCVIPNNRTFTYYYASMLSHHSLITRWCFPVSSVFVIWVFPLHFTYVKKITESSVIILRNDVLILNWKEDKEAGTIFFEDSKEKKTRNY